MHPLLMNHLAVLFLGVCYKKTDDLLGWSRYQEKSERISFVVL